MCVRRGVDSYPIKELGKDLGELQAGDQFVEGGFYLQHVILKMVSSVIMSL